MMIAPDKDYFLIVIQCPNEEEAQWCSYIDLLLYHNIFKS